MLKISLVSILVNDQQTALDFYTGVLGFEPKVDMPMGEYRWITLVSPVQPDGAQLALEPNANPAGQAFQSALYEQKVPAMAFEVDDMDAEYQRLVAAGVIFQSEPKSDGPFRFAVFDDTCGNWIQIYQMVSV